MYEFEQEVRAVIYPKRDLLDPIENPYPDMSGLHVPIRGSEPNEEPISQFIEKVYVHPTLSEDSMMVHTLKEVHKRFSVPEIAIVANKIEAMGLDIALPPRTGS